MYPRNWSNDVKRTLGEAVEDIILINRSRGLNFYEDGQTKDLIKHRINVAEVSSNEPTVPAPATTVLTLQSNEDPLLFQESDKGIRGEVKNRQSNQTPPQRRILGNDPTHGNFNGMVQEVRGQRIRPESPE